MTKILLPVIALMLASPSISFGADAKAACTCDTACAEKCAKGPGSKDCTCKACDCGKTGKCSHGKCGADHSHDKKN